MSLLLGRLSNPCLSPTAVMSSVNFDDVTWEPGDRRCCGPEEHWGHVSAGR